MTTWTQVKAKLGAGGLVPAVFALAAFLVALCLIFSWGIGSLDVGQKAGLGLALTLIAAVLV